MKLKDYTIEGDRITLSKKELEEWAGYYSNTTLKAAQANMMLKATFESGKTNSILDILRLFDNENSD